jgi:hypothetical protein
MTIATTVVTDTFFATAITHIPVSAQCNGAALLQGIQGAQGKSIGMTLGNKRFPKL